MISQIIKGAAIFLSVFLIIWAAAVFYKKSRNQTKSQTRAEIKRIKLFRFGALVYAIIICFCYTLASYFDTAKQASAIVALNYAEASLGQNVNGTRFNMSEIISDDVVSRLIKKGGFDDLTVDDLKACLSVTAINQGNSYSKDKYHISTEFSVSYQASKKTKKYDSNAVVQLLCNSYRDYYFDNYVNDFQLPEEKQETEELDYIDAADLLSARANNILNYLYGLREKNSAFISSNGSTFTSVAAKVEMLSSAQISDSVYSFILQNGISKDSERLISRYTYTNVQYGYEKEKLRQSYDITNSAVAKYDKDMARIVLVPTWDNDGQYYMGRTKIGIDTLSKQSVSYSNSIAAIEKSIKDNELKIEKFREAAGNSEENRAYAASLIAAAEKSLESLAHEAREIGQEYYSSQMNECISATVYQGSLISKFKTLAVVTVLAYIAFLAKRSAEDFGTHEEN